MKHVLRSLLIQQGVYIGRVTSRVLLNDFFQKIKPVRTNYNLIRLGGAGDGGYLVPDDLDGIEYCFSPGVSAVADFELDLTKRNVKCFLADYSVDAPPIKNNLFDFEKKYLGPVEDDVFITLDGWVRRKVENKSDFILQMDIEGAEYAVINDVDQETLKKFRVVVVEFHDLHALLDASAFELINITFDKILKNFDVVHIHPNNVCAPIKYKEFSIPPVMEFTFLRKDRISERSPCVNFPHVLDGKNVPSMEDLVLPSCWFSDAS